ncbi:MAG: Cyclic di-GMP phosphodiesterase response regulator RpfG [Syntrophorhabdus sp. PtaB.Bin047]|nr:MAG: Cyclic di-GMP phosphodiesterase response regulator RpfG [Syntrophorhabdus sp. PtaB.Bin047]
MRDTKYMAIPPGAILPGSLPKFKIYVLSPDGRYILWARSGNEVSRDRLVTLAETGQKEVYIDLDEEIKYERYLENNLGTILENQAMPDDQKAEVFSRVSTNVVKDTFESSLGLGTMRPDSLRRTQALVNHSLMFIAESNSLKPLAKMIGHDYKTYEHATKVLWFTVAFLRRNSDVLTQIVPDIEAYHEVQVKELLKQCGVGAMLHDIGKVFVAPEILNKEGPLNSVEWEIVKRHPLTSFAMLADTDTPVFVKKAILQHHEDYNGEGYPMGLKGKNINVLARVLRIVDVFDAMTSRRPYKEAFSPMEAARVMVGTPEGGHASRDGNGRDPRDKGMKKCFDEKLLRKFIVFLGKVSSEM